MFKGSQIPEILTVAGLLDRTLWVLRYRFFEYMRICFVTYVPVMLVMILLWNLRIINLDFLEGEFWKVDLIFFVLFITVPTLISDVALQYYTSYLVRDNEIHWFKAVKKGFSRSLLQYTLSRMVGTVLLVVIGGLAAFIAIIPVVGIIAYYAVVIGVYTFTFGMSAPVIIEERPPVMKVVKRNFELGKAQFWGTLLASVSATMICFCVMICIFIFFLSASGLIIALMEGQQSVMVMDNFSERFIFTLGMILVPLIFALFFTPIKSIYFSVMYYNLRARQEAFHLENSLNIREREHQQKVQAEFEAGNQEVETINATA